MTRDFSRINSKVMNKINMSKVLRLIWEKRIISAREIISQTDLTAPSVIRIVKHLIHEEKLVKNSGIGDSKGGRPPVLYEFNGFDKYVIAIDVGATYIRGVIANLNAEIFSEIQILTEKGNGYQSVIAKLNELVNKLSRSQGISQKRIVGIGIGVAGLVDKQKKRINFSPDFQWVNVNFFEDMSKNLEIPIYLENSTRLMALGELCYGIGKHSDNYVVVNVGYGIAAGIVLNGETISGSLGHSGEFGHMTIEPDSEIFCDCGQKGCLEALASGRRIAEVARERINECTILKDLSLNDIKRIDAKMVFDAAKLGDNVAEEILDTAIGSLCVGIRGLISLLDPEIILIGGGVSLNGDMFFNKVNRGIKGMLMPPQVINTIRPVTFRENATIVGAIALVLERVLNLELTN